MPAEMTISQLYKVVGSIIKVIHYIGNDVDDKKFKNNFAGINNSCIFALLKVIKIMVKL